MNAVSKLALAASLFAAAAFASAQDHAHGGHEAHGAHGAQAAAKAAAVADLVNGEVKKVDKDAGKITLRHDEIKHLGMPVMSMVFRVKDRAMLDRVKTGDKVRFMADRVNGALTIVELKAAR